jgi:hypothetical protein
MRLLRAKRKEADRILKDPVGYLERLGEEGGKMFATQESIGINHRRCEWARPTMFATQESITDLSVGMWNYLKARALFATHEGIAVSGAGRV